MSLYDKYAEINAIGTTGAKIDLHPKKCIIAPPKAGPVIPPIAIIDAFSPSAVPLSLPLNRVAIIPLPFDTRIDAPNASIHLNTMSIPKFGAKQFNNAPVPNIKKPVE